MNSFIVPFFLIFYIKDVLSVNNGLGRTPGMGYNTWNDFRCNGINEANVKAVADKMHEMGLRDHGYEYINIDDCWSQKSGRDNNGKLIADPKAFPNGMKAVADYVHSKGFKFGIYTDRGTKTCAGYPASLNFEKSDADTFAEWGVDYLKEDSCNASGNHTDAFTEYGAMRDALNATGRPIYFSLCGWNSWYAPMGKSLGNSWRVSGDVNGWESVYNAINVNIPLAKYAEPGAWNDPDMLVGSGTGSAVHNTPDQSRTQFSLWSMMAAPLLIGSNILGLSEWDMATYTNDEVIAVDQDILGIQGTPVVNTCGKKRVLKDGSVSEWSDFIPMHLIEEIDILDCYMIFSKKLSGGSVALSLTNFAQDAATVTCDSTCMQKIGFASGAGVRDLWAKKDLGPMTTVSAKLAGSGQTAMFKLTGRMIEK